ncbi:MAG TPA: MliC family protein [Candidatus Paceibacterota bacterium]|jgi:Predicted periplasmic protein
MKKILAILIILIIAFAVWRYVAPRPISSVAYACDASKTIGARYFKDHVDVKFDDGRAITLPQAISADGARYANADESLVFWSKGNSVMVLEDGAESTYKNCSVRS